MQNFKEIIVMKGDAALLYAILLLSALQRDGKEYFFRTICPAMAGLVELSLSCHYKFVSANVVNSYHCLCRGEKFPRTIQRW